MLQTLRMTVAETKSPKWRRLCPPAEATDFGPMGAKPAVLDGNTEVVAVLMDPATYERLQPLLI